MQPKKTIADSIKWWVKKSVLISIAFECRDACAGASVIVSCCLYIFMCFVMVHHPLQREGGLFMSYEASKMLLYSLKTTLPFATDTEALEMLNNMLKVVCEIY